MLQGNKLQGKTSVSRIRLEAINLSKELPIVKTLHAVALLILYIVTVHQSPVFSRERIK